LLVADLGCGRGHLGRLLLPSIAPGGRVDGFDADPDQVRDARSAAKREGLSALRFEEADARDVPRTDASYDLVCCQALLTHLSRPEEVAREMARLAKPGGRVALIEPDIPGQTIAPREPAPELRALASARVHAATEGVRRLGLGSWDASSRLELLLLDEGLVIEHAALLPGVMPLTPPYGPEEAPLAQALLSWESESSAEAEASTLRWLASEGGMADKQLDALEGLEREARRQRARALRAETWTGVVHRPMAMVVGRTQASL
jgi:SAM-dependent methyltransferase